MSLTSKLETLKSAQRIAGEVAREYNSIKQRIITSERERLYEAFFSKFPAAKESRGMFDINVVFDDVFGHGGAATLEKFASINLPNSFDGPPEFDISMGDHMKLTMKGGKRKTRKNRRKN